MKLKMMTMAMGFTIATLGATTQATASDSSYCVEPGQVFTTGTSALSAWFFADRYGFCGELEEYDYTRSATYGSTVFSKPSDTACVNKVGRRHDPVVSVAVRKTMRNTRWKCFVTYRGAR